MAKHQASDMLTIHGTVMGCRGESIGCELNSISHADKGPVTLARSQKQNKLNEV
jgi:hypothetical protein